MNIPALMGRAIACAIFEHSNHDGEPTSEQMLDFFEKVRDLCRQPPDVEMFPSTTWDTTSKSYDLDTQENINKNNQEVAAMRLALHVMCCEVLDAWDSVS